MKRGLTKALKEWGGEKGGGVRFGGGRNRRERGGRKEDVWYRIKNVRQGGGKVSKFRGGKKAKLSFKGGCT